MLYKVKMTKTKTKTVQRNKSNQKRWQLRCIATWGRPPSRQ